MDEKRRSKRKSLTVEDGFWDCSVCTYRNSPEAFKCEMCDVRKGTSTRKPRMNPNVVVQQQVAQQVFTTPPVKKEKREKPAVGVGPGPPLVAGGSHSGGKKEGVMMGVDPRSPGVVPGAGGESTAASSVVTTVMGGSKHAAVGSRKNRLPRLKNVDRSTAHSMEVTVGNVTVVITDYQPKKPSEAAASNKQISGHGGNPQSSPGGISQPSNAATATHGSSRDSPGKASVAPPVADPDSDEDTDIETPLTEADTPTGTASATGQS